MIPLTISCDDVNPSKGYRILGEKTEKWFRSLHDDYGCKFSLFVPSCYHGKYPLSQHKEWVKELMSIDWLEICGHGHYHMTSDSRRFGECEFLELNTWRSVDDRMGLLKREWDSVGIKPTGWRNPGWLCSKSFNDWINSIQLSENNWFKYIAIHYEHNNSLQWNIPTFFGHDGIQQTNIGIHNVSEKHPNGMIMFTSHIAGNHNHNVWNEDNYNQLRGSIEFLLQNEEITFNTLNELV